MFMTGQQGKGGVRKEKREDRGLRREKLLRNIEALKQKRCVLLQKLHNRKRHITHAGAT